MESDSKTWKRNILATCALPYSNGDIHVGHLVEYIQADIWVRFQKMRGNRCLFFCADDTHGTPIMLAAKKRKISPEEMIKEKKQAHIEDFRSFEINFTHYSDTHSPLNRKIVDRFFKSMETHQTLNFREVEQAYCNQCKMFLPDRFIKGTCPKCGNDNQYGDSCDQCGSTYNPLEMKNPFCVICGEKPNNKKSEHLFFRLSDFQDFLQEWVPVHTSPEVARKLEEWLRNTLRDWNISRDAPYFGFNIPGYPGKFFYVWMDAPVGYIATTAEWGQDHKTDYEEIWNSSNWEIHHFIGKDIIYFHGLFWPAMLKNTGLSTPTRIHAHGFLTINGEKMSKSKNTFINARDYLQYLNPLYLRYYFFSKISPDLNDIDLNWNDFREKINSILIAKITNIASRCLQMLHKKSGGQLTSMTPEGISLIEKFRGEQETLAQRYEDKEYVKVAVTIRDMAEKTNRYLDDRSPWKMKNKNLRDQVLTDGINLFRVITIYLAPVLPSFAEKVAGFFYEENYRWESLKSPVESIKTAPYEYLITRIEESTINNLTHPQV